MAESGFKGHPECRWAARADRAKLRLPALVHPHVASFACLACSASPLLALIVWLLCGLLPLLCGLLPPLRSPGVQCRSLPSPRPHPRPRSPASAPLAHRPLCRFCRKRYYGENELYAHMHTGHEQCFLCRRAAPHRFVYYRDYPDLESELLRCARCALAHALHALLCVLAELPRPGE